MIGFVFVLTIVSLPLSNALTVIVNETLQPNTTYIDPSNWNGTKTILGNGYGVESGKFLTSSVADYTEVPYTTAYTYGTGTFSVYPGWTYGWINTGSQYLYADTYFHDADFNVDDRVRNASFNVTKRIIGGTYGLPVVQNGASGVPAYGLWSVPVALSPFQYTYGSVSNTQTKDGNYAYHIWGQYGWLLVDTGSYCQYTLPVANRTNVDTLKLDVKIADIECGSLYVGKLAGGIYVWNYRTSTWDTIHTSGAVRYGNTHKTVIGAGGYLNVYSWYENTFTFYDAGTGNANSYFSTYPNVENTGGNVVVMFCDAKRYGAPGTAYGEAGVAVDYVGISENGYDTLSLSEDIPLTINGISSSTCRYIVPTEYAITNEGAVGPYTFSETYYQVESEFDLGNVATANGDLYYTNTNTSLNIACGLSGNKWVLSMTSNQVNQAINETGFFTNNWTHEIGGVPQSTSLYVDSRFNFQTNHTYGFPDISNGVLDVAIPYDSKDLTITLSSYDIVNTTIPTEILVQTIDVTGSSYFALGSTFPYGTLTIPYIDTFTGSSTTIIRVTHDFTPPTNPIISGTNLWYQLTDLPFTCVPSDDVSYVFLVYQDSSGHTYIQQMSEDIASGTYYVTLQFVSDTYTYWYYLIDDVGNVRTSQSTQLSVIVVTYASLNVNGLLSWIAVISAIVGGVVVVSQTKYKRNTWVYVGLVGAGATVLIIMSIFGLFPVTLNLLAIETVSQMLNPFTATIGYTILGVGIAIAVISGYFIFKYVTKPKM